MAALIPYLLHRGTVRADIGNRAFRSGNLPLIVFTHHYGGSERNLWRHVELVNKMGFDAVTFNFSWHGPQPRYSLPIRMQHVWALEIESVLSQFSDRKKVIYSFSGPGIAALEYISRRVETRKFDIVGFICDSGPFADPWFCTRRLIEHHFGIKNKWLAEAKLAWMMSCWGFGHEKNIHSYIAKISAFARDLPILSIRGAMDPLVPPRQIGAVFGAYQLPQLTVEIFEQSGHLDAIKKEPEKYKDIVGNFLSAYFS